MDKKRILESVIKPKNSGNDENMDLLRYRVDYLREKRKNGELPPLQSTQFSVRLRGLWEQLKDFLTLALVGVGFLVVGIVASPYMLGEGLYQHIRTRRIMRPWNRTLASGSLETPPPLISRIDKKWLKVRCLKNLWKRRKPEILNLVQHGEKHETIRDLVQVLLSEADEPKERNRIIFLSKEERYILTNYEVKFSVEANEHASADLAYQCLMDPMISKDDFLDTAQIYFGSAPDKAVWNSISVSMYNQLVSISMRTHETDLMALVFSLLGRIPDTENRIRARFGGQPNIHEFLSSAKDDPVGTQQLAKAIASDQRQLTCLQFTISDSLFLFFIGPNGTEYHDFSSGGLEEEKIYELLRKTHGLFSVAPLARVKRGNRNEASQFYNSFLQHRFSNEIEEDSSRLTDSSLSKLLLEISDLFSDPISVANSSLACDSPRASISFTPDDPLAFLPIESAQLFAIENGHPDRQPIVLDQRRHFLPEVSTVKGRISAKILLIGDPSYSLDYSPLEIELISEIFEAKNIVRLELQDAIQFTKKGRLLPEVDVLHFIGHHQFSYKQGVQSNVPSLNGNTNESDFLRVFSKFGAQLNFLSACSTNSTFFTDPKARQAALSQKILNRYPCNVISTLWPIPDEPAAYFSQRFYQNLAAAEGNPSEALHATKASFARGDVEFLDNLKEKNMRLGGPSVEGRSWRKSPQHWGSYILN